MSELRLLAIADVHYSSVATEMTEELRYLMGRVLLRRALDGARRSGGFDAVALLGDLIHDGNSTAAEAELSRLRDDVRASAGRATLLVVPGNHDGDPRRVLRIFEDEPGLHEIGGYRFVSFADAFAEDNTAARSEAGRRFLADLAAKPGPPIVVCQHNPMHPAIESDYPFMLANDEQVRDDYARLGVLLSLSGHYHDGQPLHTHRGVQYLTVPALCKAPPQYAMIALKEREVSAEVRGLEDCGGGGRAAS
jgi:predicted MPP superfamily phosphohydrolase